MDLSADGQLPGERLLWWGRPQRLTLTLLDWGQFAIGLLWGIATIVIPVARHDPLSFLAWVVGVGGLASLWGAVAARVRARRSVAYLVTDRRIVLADRFSGRTRASAYLGTLPPPFARIRQDGSGTIVFRSSSRFGLMPARSSVPLLVSGLVAVPEAGRVRDLIAWAQAGQA
ncbi:hypothetical protein DMA12_03410 [Amycolatopsis balhimycina DSM 5908]|uniref:DUF304 domain-containing protein n=1 Tax=Amycolatopsis balhimycina DSM 5908 TaxID=1081091 RepID=A0A428X2D4_AMYBA|nr:hypothetical protein [Amycolatopsis balhimycina]RSM49488.1 hypothetical protein DMA12_03410 [Amycolatopsis balhimycina DSM 5908]